jgi:polyisoprenoid-binding protein YceI
MVALATADIGPCPDKTSALAVSLEQSSIRWRGTKFWGLGRHEGTVRLAAGHLCLRGDAVIGGRLEVDMRTIEVTDIPADDPIPRNRLREHLLGDDFFATEAHPTARFDLLSATVENGRLYRVAGDLTIRGSTHPISFYARGWTVTAGAVRAEARVEIDRHRWGVSYRGSTIKDDLVDDTLWLELILVAGR